MSVAELIEARTEPGDSSWQVTGSAHAGQAIARTIGAMYLIGAAIGGAWILTPGVTLISEPLIWGVLAIGSLLGLWLLSGADDPRRPRFFAGTVLTANLLTSVALYSAGPSEAVLGLFYVWAAPIAFVFLPLRQALGQALAAAVLLALALALHALSQGSVPSLHDLAYAVVIVASILVVGSLARKLTAATRTSDELFRRGFVDSFFGVALLSPELEILEPNEALARMIGTSTSRLIGRSLAELTHPDDRDLALEDLSDARVDGGGIAYAPRLLRADGETISVRISATMVADPAGEPSCVFALIEDVTERRRSAEQLAQLAHENDQILRAAGDGIYRTDAEGRITFVNPAASDLLGWSRAELLGREPHMMFHHKRPDGAPFPLAACPVHGGARVEGVHRSSDEVYWRANGSSFPVDYTTAPVREDGRITGSVCVFADITETLKREAELRDQLDWQERIGRAISERRLVVHGQPIVDLASGEVVTHELLVRVRDRKTGELIMPAAFIPHAERCHLMPVIDRYMVLEALRIARSGQAVAANLSSQTLADPQVLSELEQAAALGAGLERLVLEITETAAVENMDGAREFAARVRELGCRIALDDFGTGFGAFSYLRNMPIDFLKIDIDFVRDLVTSRSDQRIVRSIVGIANELDLRTIAEGVEDAATARMLRQLDVDMAQGYHFGRPGPISSEGPGGRGETSAR